MKMNTVSETKKFKVGDKVTIVNVGIGYVKEVLPDFGYTLYIVNLRKFGAGWLDRDLRAGWVRV